MDVGTQNNMRTKVKITTGQAATTAKQAANWHRLWERLLSQSEGKEIPERPSPPVESGNNHQGVSQ